MSDNNYKKIGVAPRFHEALSTGLYTGLVPVAPGTAAALVALVLWYGLYLVLSPAILFWTTIPLLLSLQSLVFGHQMLWSNIGAQIHELL